MERAVDNLYIANELLKMAEVHRNDKFRYGAYRSAAGKIRAHDKPILSGQQAREEIKGVGESVGKKIDEILQTGQLKEVAELKDEVKERMRVTQLFQNIHGVGKVTAEKWFEAGYKTLEELYPLYENSVMTPAQKIGYVFYSDFQEKIPRIELDLAKRIFKSVFPTYLFEFAGSYRRGAEFSGDLDVLFCSSKSDGSEVGFVEVVDTLTNSGFIVAHLTDTPGTKYMGVFKINAQGRARRIDIRLIPKCHWAASLLYFTGSKELNILMRNRALELGYSLSEYGLQKSNPGDPNLLPPPNFESEMEIFSFLGLRYLAPEERTAKLLSLATLPALQTQKLIVRNLHPELSNVKILACEAEKINWQASRLAIFDLDGTLIQNCHGKVFSLALEEIEVMPRRPEGLQFLLNNGFSLLVVSNQKIGPNRTLDKIGAKLIHALELLNLPCFLMAALDNDHFRKPGIGFKTIIEKYFPKVELAASFFCGDAAGREGDFSDSDLRFAQNYGLPFLTPEEFFALG